jgi:ABC-type transport system involved in multi-copper enzyme maturation permease subunit
MSRIISVAKNTFREAIRDRVLYNLILFFLLITASANFLGELTAGNEARTIVNMGLAASLIFGVLIAIFVGVGLVSKEIEKRTIYAIFAKPIRREEFLLGKFLGLCVTLLVNTFIMGIGISLALLYVGDKVRLLAVWIAIFLIYIELCLMVAVAMLFSSFSSPALSALFSFSIFIIGHLSSSLKDLAQELGSQSAKIFFAALYYVLPNLSHFSFITQASHGEVPQYGFIIVAVIYAIVYACILLSISLYIFSNRDFK